MGGDLQSGTGFLEQLTKKGSGPHHNSSLRASTPYLFPTQTRLPSKDVNGFKEKERIGNDLKNKKKIRNPKLSTDATHC